MRENFKRTIGIPAVLLFTLAFASIGLAQQPKAALSQNSAPLIMNKVPNQILSAQLKFQKPLARGSIQSMGGKQVQLSPKTTASLSTVAAFAFKPLERYTAAIVSRAKIGKTILTQPVIKEEALEFQDAFVIQKSTTVNVIDPAAMKRISPQFRAYLQTRSKPKQMAVKNLDAEERRGLMQLMQKARTFPAQDPMRVAARKGEQALLDAVLQGKGELTIEDTLVVPKMAPMPVKGVTRYPVIKNGRLDFNQLKPVTSPVLKALNRIAPPAKLTPITNFKMQTMTMAPKNPSVPQFNKTGRQVFNANFLAGFTLGHSWQWERRWSYRSGFFRVTIGGGYGLGLRVPVKATGEISPTNVYRYDRSDRSETINGKISVETLDGDENFYRSTGLAGSKLFRGNEVVLEYQMGFGYKLRALWKDLAHKPFGGFGVNYSQNARPPWGANCSDCGFHVPIPPEITRTTLNFSVMTGFVQTGFHVSGTGKAFFKLTPMIDGVYKEQTDMMFDRTGYVPFHFNVPRLTLPSGRDEVTSQFGFKLSHLVYRMGMSVTPEVRVGVRAGYKSFSRTFATDWIALNQFQIRMGTLQLYAHEGTRPDYTYTGGTKTFEKMTVEKFDIKKTKKMPVLKTN